MCFFVTKLLVFGTSFGENGNKKKGSLFDFLRLFILLIAYFFQLASSVSTSVISAPYTSCRYFMPIS